MSCGFDVENLILNFGFICATLSSNCAKLTEFSFCSNVAFLKLLFGPPPYHKYESTFCPRRVTSLYDVRASKFETRVSQTGVLIIAILGKSKSNKCKSNKIQICGFRCLTPGETPKSTYLYVFGFAILGFGFPLNGNYQNPRLQNPGFELAGTCIPEESYKLVHKIIIRLQDPNKSQLAGGV